MAQDTRRFHVPSRYAAYANMDPYQILNHVNDDLVSKFKEVSMDTSIGSGRGTPAEAKMIESYLRDLKSLAWELSDPTGKLGHGKASLTSGIAREALEQVLLSSGHSGDALFRKWLGLSSKAQGDVFEAEMGDVMAGTFNIASGGLFQSAGQDFVWGSAQVNVGGMKEGSMVNLARTAGKEIIQAAYESMSQSISSKDASSIAMQHLFSKEVYGKIDIAGMKCTFDFSMAPTSQLTTVAKLLQKATFSVKSYASLRKTVDKKTKTRLASLTQELTLGSTTAKRIIVDVLSGYVPFEVALSYSYAIMQSHDVELQTTLMKLRFIYELTGVGQTYLDETYQEWAQENSALGSKYFIYNDPASGAIFVKSSAEIITDMKDQMLESIKWNDNTNKWHTGLSKSYSGFR